MGALYSGMQVCNPPAGWVVAKFVKACFLNSVILLGLAAESFPTRNTHGPGGKLKTGIAEVSTL